MGQKTPAPGNTKKKRKPQKIPCLRFASWNVRTLCPGLSNDIKQVDGARKTAIIDKELSRLGVDIACLQETRLAGSGTLREESYTFFWQGKPPEEPCQHGVGFAVKNTLVTSIEPPTAGTKRILNFRLSTSTSPANIISVYAPTLCAAPDDKDQFFEALDEAISRIPSTDAPYLLGDFNARVGADCEAWPSCLSAYGCGKMNMTTASAFWNYAATMACVSPTLSSHARKPTRSPGDTYVLAIGTSWT